VVRSRTTKDCATVCIHVPPPRRAARRRTAGSCAAAATRPAVSAGTADGGRQSEVQSLPSSWSTFASQHILALLRSCRRAGWKADMIVDSYLVVVSIPKVSDSRRVGAAECDLMPHTWPRVLHGRSFQALPRRLFTRGWVKVFAIMELSAARTGSTGLRHGWINYGKPRKWRVAVRGAAGHQSRAAVNHIRNWRHTANTLFWIDH